MAYTYDTIWNEHQAITHHDPKCGHTGENASTALREVEVAASILAGGLCNSFGKASEKQPLSSGFAGVGSQTVTLPTWKA